MTRPQTEAAFDAGCQTSPHAHAGEFPHTTSSLSAVRCIQVTHLGKDYKLQFSSLCDHFLSERSAPSHAWLSSMARVEPRIRQEAAE
jgi:hypothetical protein